MKPFVAGTRVLFTVLSSHHTPPPPHTKNPLLISRPNFSACTLLLPTNPQEIGDVGGKAVGGERERLKPGAGPPIAWGPLFISSFPLGGGGRRGPNTSLHPGKLLPPIPDRRAEAGSGLPCESGISERTGEWLCLAVCHFILPSFLISDSTRGFCRCKCALQLETQPFCSTGVKLAHTASHPPPHSRVSSLPVSKRHFLKSADRKGS